jgi:hypothetical protein
LTEVSKKKKEELKTAFSKITIFLHYTNVWLLVFFPHWPQWRQETIRMEPKVYFPMMLWSGDKILFRKKGITAIFPLLCRYFSITVCCLFTYIFSPLALFKVRY